MKISLAFLIMKTIIIITMVIGSWIGGYLPALWGDSFFSMSSVLFSAIGGFLGIWIGYKLAVMLGVE